MGQLADITNGNTNRSLLRRELEKILGYTFKNGNLLEEALTHPSYTHTVDATAPNYERLEFLGDSVLGLSLSKKLFSLFPNNDEGVLAQAKGALGKGEFLAEIAKTYEVNRYLRLSPSEIAQRSSTKPRILASAWEAIIGGMYLDSNYERANLWILDTFDKHLKNGFTVKAVLDILKEENPKGRLQEYWQSVHRTSRLEYVLVNAFGPEHRKGYKVLVKPINSDRILGEGAGYSKKEAEILAAQAALDALGIK